MKRPFFIIFILSLMISTNLHAQKNKDSLLPFQESILSFGDETFSEFCYFHNFISKNNHGLSFVVTTVYNSDLTRMVPFVVLSGFNPKDENLDILQIFTYDQAEEVTRYLEFLRTTSENQPKGIHREFIGPADFKIRTYDAQWQYKITFICKDNTYGATITSRKELNDWIEAFHKCLKYIEDLD